MTPEPEANPAASEQVGSGDDDPERTCPRCGAQVRMRFYGPCPQCRTALRAAYARAPRDVQSAPFEPTVHVVPNAVALKED